MENLNIKSQLGHYDVQFCKPNDSIPEDKYIYIIDKNVWNINKSKHLLKKIHDPILVEASESNKSLKEIERITAELIKRNVLKKGHLLAIGGGITQELVSFTASIYFRGISWSFIPTTLLSQADSCLGGKNSINLLNYKNILGTFYPPKKIYIFDEFIETLERKEVASGEIEILKIHLLSGEQVFKDYSHLDQKERVISALSLKKRIIEEDEFDKGERWKLNLGHNFAHALEASSKKPIPHGIAVGFGILWGLELSKNFGHISEDDYRLIVDLMREKLEGQQVPLFDQKVFLDALLRDKKNEGGNMNFILCTGVGEVGKFSFELRDCKKVFDAAFSVRL